MAKRTAEDGEEKKGKEGEGRKVRLTFAAHAKKLKTEASANGASIRLGIDPSEEMSETEFLGLIEKYRKGATA